MNKKTEKLKKTEKPKIKSLPIIDTKNIAINPDANKEVGGSKGLEPTRYGDWLVKGRVSDF